MAGLRLGLLGGTFDPIHIGHLIMGEYARQQFNLDRVLFIPTGDPWRKSDRVITLAEHRLAMTQLAIDSNPGFVLDGRETRRKGATYTVDTLRSLRGELGGEDELFLILGQDALADMVNWKEPHAIQSLARLVVVPRQGATSILEDSDLKRTGIEVLAMPFIGVSSTLIRQRVRDGRSIRYLVPEPVEAYIEQESLYRSAD